MNANIRKRPAAFKIFWDYALLTAGALIVAVGVDMFLTPNKVVPAGVTGIAVLLHFLWKWPVGTVTLVLNVPLLAAGVRWGGGWKVLARTVYAVTVMSVGIDALSGAVPEVTGDPFIYTLFGGLVDGVGIGLVLRGRGTTGGTDILAQLLHRYRRIPFGQVFLWSNTAILVLAIPVVGFVPVLYALLVNYISSRTIDAIQEGVGFGRALLIISDRMEEIRQAVLEEVGRGLTLLQGRGGFTGAPREVLYVVVARSQITRMKRLIADIDPRAFVVITEANEVLGEGFKPHRDEE